MKKKAKQILKHPLISGSTILLLGSLSGNFFNFLYNLFMSRALSIVDYGILVSIFSLISLPSLLSNSVVPTAINFAGSYMATNEFGKVKGLYLQISKLMFFLGLLCAIIFIVFSGSIASFIHITDNRPLIVLAGVIVFIGFMSFINMAFLQARLSFAFISF